MPTLLFRSPSDPPQAWRTALESACPGLEVRIHPETGDPDEIDYALIWAAPDDILHQLPNLRVVFSLGAGIDHLLGGAVPENVPIVRMRDPSLTQGMVEYVLYQVLRHHRLMPLYERQQRAIEWQAHEQIRAAERTIGVLGLGELGGACARTFADLGFEVRGYSRTHKNIDGVDSYAGPEEMPSFLDGCDFLICLLPLTDETRGMLNRDAFIRLAPGATLIHVGRGSQLVEQDLESALEHGHLGHAVLDVFAEEPLPLDHPFWQHPAITVTPHIASLTNPATGADRVAEGIRRMDAGEPIPGTVDPARGY